MSFQCNPGFQLVGSNEVQCQHNGSWSQPTGQCRFPDYSKHQCFSSLNPSTASLLMTSNSEIGLIPLKNQSLVLYSKFDLETGFNYVKPQNSSMNVEGNTELARSIAGPFSIPNSSYRTRYLGGSWLGYFEMSPKVDLTSFTLSFYLRVGGNELFGLYYDDHDSKSGHLRFSISVFGTDLEIDTHNSSAGLSAGYQTIQSYTFRNVLERNEWQFVALTYDGSRKIMKLYDETANVKEGLTNIQIDQVFTSQISIGSSYRFGYFKKFSQSSAIACLSLHNQVLSQMDIALLPCACQFKDRLQ